MQRPQTAEVEPRRDVEVGEGELEGDVDADRHAGQAPEQGHEGRELDGPKVVVRQSVDLERRTFRRTGVEALEDREYARGGDHGSEPHMEGVGGFDRLGGDEEAEQRQEAEHADQPDFAAPERLRLRYSAFQTPGPKAAARRIVESVPTPPIILVLRWG